MKENILVSQTPVLACPCRPLALPVEAVELSLQQHAKRQATGASVHCNMETPSAWLSAWTRRSDQDDYLGRQLKHPHISTKVSESWTDLSVPLLDVLALCTLFEELRLTLYHSISKGNEKILCVDHHFTFLWYLQIHAVG